MEPNSFQLSSLLLLPLLWFFLAFSPTHSCQAHAEQGLNKDELVCINKSQEETALGRWLECLESSSSSSSSSVSPFSVSLEDSIDVEPKIPVSMDEEIKSPASIEGKSMFPLLELPITEDARIPHSESPIDEDYVSKFPLMVSPVNGDSILKIPHLEASVFGETSIPKVLILDSPTELQEHDQEEQRNMAGIRNAVSSINSDERFQQHLVELSPEKDLPSGDGDGKLAMEQSGDREIEGHALSAWLQLNLGLLVLTKFLLAISWGFKRMQNQGRKWDDSSDMCIEEKNIEAVCEEKNSEYVHYQSSKWHVKKCYNQTLGSPIGSAVGAVFAEVLLTTSNCGSSVPADKINMLFKTAFKDSLAVVVGESESLRILDDFMASFRTTYTTICRVHDACLQHLKVSQNKSVEVNCIGPEVEVGELSTRIEKYSNERRPPEISSQKSAKHIESSSHGRTDKLDITKFGEISNEVTDSKSAKLEESNSHKRSDNLDITKVVQVSNEVALATGMNCGLDMKTNPVSLLSEKMESLLLDDDGNSASSAKDAGNLVEDIIVDKLQRITLSENLCSDNDLVPEDLTPSKSNNGVSNCIPDGVPSKDNNLLLAYSRDDVTELDYSTEYSSNICQEVSNVNPKMERGLNAVSLVQRKYRGEGPLDHQRSFLSFLERYVQAQEQRNQIKSVEVAHLLKQRVLEEEKIQLTSISNDLMREHILLNKSRASFKESTILEEKANLAYTSFSSTCADELVAGLFIMLISLAYGVRKYSFSLLNDLVSSCKPLEFKEPRRSLGFGVDWLYNSIDSLVGKLQSFVCHITVAGRILIGSIVVAFVAASLLRRSVTSSSQRMPATILIIVLGVICGFAGKLSVDSLGGNGMKWLVMWELFCVLHALANCYAPFFYHLLHGSPSMARKRRMGIPFWFRRLFFHFLMVLILPILAGQLPFGSFRHVMNELVASSIQGFSVLFSSLSELMPQLTDGIYKPW